MWMDDLMRNMERKENAEALPEETRMAYRKQYNRVCREAAIACIIGIAEVMTGRPQDRNAQLAKCADKIVDEWTRNCANGVIIRIGEACEAARDSANRAGCTDTNEHTPFTDADDADQAQAKYIAIASACDAYTAAFAIDCEDFAALEMARRKLKLEV